MLSSPRVALAAASWLGSLCACGARAPEIDDDLSVTDGSRNQPFEDAEVQGVAFVGGNALRMRSGETEWLRVQVSPPGARVVRFSLLARAPEAFLSSSVVTTDATGVAETQLTVVAASAEFAVRAASGSFEAQLSVESLPASTGNLRVVPRYGGIRAVDAWVASVHVNARCADIEGPPYVDGSAVATASEDAGTVALNAIPAGVPVAAVVRVARYASGCRSIDALRAGADTFIDVDVFDRPMQIRDTRLDFAFGLQASADLTPALDDLMFRAVSPLTADAEDDLRAVLDAMETLSPDTEAFAQARQGRQWRATLVSALAPEILGTGLRSLVRDWMREGLGELTMPGSLEGVLATPDAEVPGEAAEFHLERVVGLDPDAAGFRSQNAASLTAETDDFVRTGTTLSFQPSTFLAALAERVARERSGANSAAAAMSSSFDCGLVGEQLASVGENPGQAFPGCEATCIEDLCADAMGVLWSRVAGSELPAVSWALSAAARAEIDDDARPTRVEGTWVGNLEMPEYGSTTLEGSFLGAIRL